MDNKSQIVNQIYIHLQYVRTQVYFLMCISIAYHLLRAFCTHHPFTTVSWYFLVDATKLRRTSNCRVILL